jgi:hypothetical protein
MSLRESTGSAEWPMGARLDEGQDGRLSVAQACPRRTIRVRGMDDRQPSSTQQIYRTTRRQSCAHCQTRIAPARTTLHNGGLPDDTSRKAKCAQLGPASPNPSSSSERRLVWDDALLLVLTRGHCCSVSLCGACRSHERPCPQLTESPPPPAADPPPRPTGRSSRTAARGWASPGRGGALRT